MKTIQLNRCFYNLLYISSFFYIIVGSNTFPPPLCIPKEGKTGIIIGQDYDSIRNYTINIKSNHKPYGLMSYTALVNDYGELTGTKEPIDYGSGIQWTDGLSNEYPDSVIQLGLWLVGQCTKILTGLYDRQINELARYIEKSNSNYILRIGYEFDSFENNYPVTDYIFAYRRIVNHFRKLEIENIVFVWHASGFKPRDGLEYEDWFPGASYVDLCGVSFFQQPYDCQIPMECKMIYPEKLASFCKSQNIPIMIAESTPFGGIIDEITASSDPNAKNDAGYSGSTWNRWFVPIIAYIERHNVRIWSYINCNWNQQPMWKKNHSPGVLWGDTRIETSKDITNRWEVEVLHNERFITNYPIKSNEIEGLCLEYIITDDANINIDDYDNKSNMNHKDIFMRIWDYLISNTYYFLFYSFIIIILIVLYYQFFIPHHDYQIIP